MDTMDMRAGYGRENLELNIPVPTIHSRLRGRMADRILDPLRVFATVWESGGCRGAFITIDVLGVPIKFTRELRESLSTQGFSPQAVLINATHTHTSPTFVSMARICRDYPEFYDEALRATLKAIDRAIEDLAPAVLEVCNSSCPISLNRRQIGRLCDINDIGAPSGEVDDRLTVLRLKRPDEDILLVHFAAHPLTVWADPFVISADYPGRLVNAVERMYPGSRCQFLQGTCGNVNLKIHGDDRTSEIVADMLAHSVMHSLENSRSIAVDSVKCMICEVSLPLDRAGTLEDRSAIHEAFSSVYSEEAWLAWLAEIQISDGPTEMRICSRTEIQGLKLGEFSIIALPGEPFAEIGGRIRELGADLVLGYTNSGDCGYLPSAKAFAEGGYETDTSYWVYSNTFKYSPMIEDALVCAAERVLSEMGDR